jgi:DNA polymerase-1
VLALMGDSVDNVPGVRGVGPKTATKLIVEYGDLEKALAGAQTMKASKLRDNLIEHADMARLSRILVELKRDVPLIDGLDDLKLGAIPPEPLKTFLDEHGFRSLSAKLDLGATPGGPPTFPRANAAPVAAAPAGPSTPALPPMPAIDRSLYECVTTIEALDRWIAEARTAHVVGVDTETASLDSVTGRLVGVSMATAPGRACYIPLGHGGTDMFAEKPDQIAMDEALARLGDLFADDAVLKVGHNLKYDIGVLAQHGLTVAPYDDTLVMSFALDAGKHQHGLDELAKLHLDHTCLTFKDMCGSGKSQISFAEVQLDRATEYAAEDADVALRLWKLLKLRLPIEGGTRVYEMVDRPLAAIVERMERAGIMVDREYLARLSGEFATEMLRIEGEIHALAGQPFAIGSPKQLGEILFDKLGLKGGRKGKSGDWSTDLSELERLERDGVPIARKILEWRQLAKLKSTYTDALAAADQRDDRPRPYEL